MRRVLMLLALTFVPSLLLAQSGIWVTTMGGGGGTPGGSDTQVQYNNGGVFGGDSGLVWDDTTKTLSISGYAPAATLGSEMVTNGTFTGSATGWTLGGGGGAPDWAYATNNVTHGDSGGTSALQPSTPLTFTASTYYVVSVTLSGWTAGSFTVTIGGTSAGFNYGTGTTPNGVYQAVILSAGAGNLLITPTTTFVGTIDDVSAKAMTLGSYGLSVAGTAGSFLVRTPISTSLYLGQSATGQSSQSGNGNTAVGSGTLRDLTVAVNNTAVGLSALRSLTTGADNVVIGSEAALNVRGFSTRNVAIGRQSLQGGGTGSVVSRNVAIGYASGASVTGNDNVMVGASAGQTTGATDFTIAIGSAATPTASNQGVIGGNGASGGISEMYIGHGVFKSSPEDFLLRGTTGTSGNNPGSDFGIGPGAGTGNAVGGDLVLYRSPSGASSSTVQTLVNALFVRSQAKTLTADTATDVFNVTGLGAHIRTGGMWEWCVEAGDGTNDQIACCHANWAAIDTTAGAGGETCSVTIDETPCTAALQGAASSGTLTVSADTATGTDLCTFRITSTSSLSETTNRITYTVVQNGPSGTIVPQ